MVYVIEGVLIMPTFGPYFGISGGNPVYEAQVKGKYIKYYLLLRGILRTYNNGLKTLAYDLKM